MLPKLRLLTVPGVLDCLSRFMVIMVCVCVCVCVTLHDELLAVC